MQTQNDFYSLHAANWHHAGTKTLDDSDLVSSSGDAHMESCDEAYVPVNFIKPEVYAIIAAWEAFELTQMKVEPTESAGDDTIWILADLRRRRSNLRRRIIPTLPTI